MTTNKFGLQRNIPEQVKREVRRRCGFGCIICGVGIYQYEHFNPEFNTAKTHDANGITLLCGYHHDKKTRGLISAAKIKKANSDPYPLKSGTTFGDIENFNTPPKIILGSTIIENCKVFLEIGYDRVIWMEPSSEKGEGFLLNAHIKDENGKTVLKIIKNEWRVGVNTWDITTVGKSLTIRDRPREITL